jgi:hypothetical protein
MIYRMINGSFLQSGHRHILQSQSFYHSFKYIDNQYRLGNKIKRTLIKIRTLLSIYNSCICLYHISMFNEFVEETK